MPPVPARVYTPAEKARRTRLLLKGAKNAYGDTSAIDRELDRIEERAEDRAWREARALHQQLENAKNEVAAAKAKERVASRQDRPAAREARKKAEQHLRAAERAARKFNP